jgi:hypothetical protein
MTEKATKSDKPAEPAYPGGEDEDQASKPSQRSNELPVDESDDGPAAAAEDTAGDE